MPRLLSRTGEPLGDDEARRFGRRIERRARREPLQHIVNVWPFLELELRVDGRALVPRPETEDLVQSARRRLAREADALAADVGTGGGCIALALARSHPRCRVVALDASDEALRLAAENRAATRSEERVALVRGDLLAPLGGRRLDLVVANLPYVAPHELPGLEPEVREFEPRGALVAGRDGLAEIERLVRQAPSRLAPGGWLLLETAPRQAAAVAGWLGEGSFEETRVELDRFGRERIVVARRR